MPMVSIERHGGLKTASESLWLARFQAWDTLAQVSLLEIEDVINSDAAADDLRYTMLTIAAVKAGYKVRGSDQRVMLAQFQ
jgi:hypothetical protein